MCKDTILKKKDIKIVKQSANLFIINEIFMRRKYTLLKPTIIYKKKVADSVFYDNNTKEGIQFSRDKYKISQSSIFHKSVFNKEEAEKLCRYTKIDKGIFTGEELLEICNLTIFEWIIYYSLKSFVYDCRGLNTFNENNLEYIRAILNNDSISICDDNCKNLCLAIARELNAIKPNRTGDTTNNQQDDKFVELLYSARENALNLYVDIEKKLKQKILEQLDKQSKQIYMLQLQIFLLEIQRKNASLFVSFNQIENFLSSHVKFSNGDIRELKTKLRKINEKIKQLK